MTVGSADFRRDDGRPSGATTVSRAFGFSRTDADTTPTLEQQNGPFVSSGLPISSASGAPIVGIGMAHPPVHRISPPRIDTRRQPSSQPPSAPSSSSPAAAPSRNSIFSTSFATAPPDNLDAPTSSRLSIRSLDSLSNISVADSSVAGDSLRLGVSPHITDLKPSSSIRSRRNWDEFEGKPVSPLPSPAVQHEQARDMFDVPTSRKDSTDAASLTSNGSSSNGFRQQLTTTHEVGSKNWSIFGTSTSASSLLARAPSVKAAHLSNRTVSHSDALEAPRNSGHRVVSADLGSHPTRSAPRQPTLLAKESGQPTSSVGASNARSSSALYLYNGAPGQQTFSSTPGFSRHVRIGSGESSLSADPLNSPLSAVDPTGPSAQDGMFNLNSTSQISLSAISDVPSATHDGLPPNVPWAPGSPHVSRTRSQLQLDDDRSAQSSPASSIAPRLEFRSWRDIGENSSENLLGSTTTPATAATTSPTAGVSRESSRRGNSRHSQGPSESATGSSFLPHPSLRQKQSYSPIVEENKTTSSGSLTTPTISAADDEEEEDGARIGPYHIEKTLGVGAFSRVALGRLIATQQSKTSKPEKLISSLSALRQRARRRPDEDTHAQEPPAEELVALKMLDREPCNQNERLKVSWVREVEVLKHISHPNLVRFITSFSTPLHHTLVLEQVVGGELFEALTSHFDQFAEREWLVRTMYSELANAVGWMHQVNLVHRDIKLENILLTARIFSTESAQNPLRPNHLPNPGPLVKLTDFGLSRFINPSNPLLETRCGSEEYAAPELIIGKKYDGRKTDAWALGVVLYALITGSLPFIEDIGTGVGGAREGHGGERDPRERKRHLLRIAKGDLRWPAQSNETYSDRPDPSQCPANLRLVTPVAKAMVMRLLRRDATKRATPWETWDEPWLLCGSFGQTDDRDSTHIQMQVQSHITIQFPNEASAAGQAIRLHHDPRSQEGQAWLDTHATIRQNEVSQLACD
ncbi:kinase-like protein, partial [Testicularia cyperi]